MRGGRASRGGEQVVRGGESGEGKADYFRVAARSHAGAGSQEICAIEAHTRHRAERAFHVARLRGCRGLRAGLASAAAVLPLGDEAVHVAHDATFRA